ncbi:ion channel [Microbulbifer yueqingensis]|nr:ion channel [Microbulbifer yueqingensis]
MNLIQSVNALVVIFILHVVEALYFTAIYWVAHQWLELGEFTSGFRDIFRDYFYFSLVSMTTLGLSEFNPVGHLKVITALQSLLGFMMLTWSATFYFKALSKNN